MTTITLEFAGQSGVQPRLGRVLALDKTYSEIITAGFLNEPARVSGNSVLPTDFIAIVYEDGASWFNPSISSSGVITLVPTFSPINVTLPTIADHIATYADVDGNLAENATTAINGGNLQAGLSGTAGYLASFPTTALKGSLRVTGVANTGDTVTTISNVAMGQASVISIPDPATATANFAVAPAVLVNNNLVKASGTGGLVADAGARIVSNTTAAYAGGGTSNAFTANGLTVASKGSAVIRASTNSVSITKALPGTNTLTITFSADPGADTTVDYIYTTALQA